MMMPGIEKHNRKYDEALQRVQVIYAKHPDLAALDAERATLLQRVGEAPEDLAWRRQLRDVERRRQQLIKQVGLRSKDFNPQFECELCQDSGWVQVVDEIASHQYGYEITRQKECACLIAAQQQQRLERLFMTACLVPGMEKQTFRRFKIDVYSDIAYKNNYSYRTIMSHNKDIARRFARDMVRQHRSQQAISGRGLYLQGDPGVGKTFLCSAIANELLKNNVPVLYLPFVDFLYSIKDTFNDRDKRTQELLAAAREVDVLILDDLGSENITDFSQEILFSLLNYRGMNEMKPIVISSNYPIEEIAEMYHPRIFSRINKQTLILDCVGDDLRVNGN